MGSDAAQFIGTRTPPAPVSLGLSPCQNVTGLVPENLSSLRSAVTVFGSSTIEWALILQHLSVGLTRASTPVRLDSLLLGELVRLSVGGMMSVAGVSNNLLIFSKTYHILTASSGQYSKDPSCGLRNQLRACVQDIEMLKSFGTRLAPLIFAAASVASAQSATTKGDIPTIAKAARQAIVTIVMADDDKPISRGSGFLVRSDGAIVTNYHVIATGNLAVVKFADGTISPVDGVLATDKVHDLAIIKIHGKTFPTLALGDSDQIQVGEEVVAIGNPLGLELTVSNGILSGIRSDEKGEDKLLQITAPISRGSSGGPLFNMFGEVIGINAMFLEGGESLNFAIPVNDAKGLLLETPWKLLDLPNETEQIKSRRSQGDAPPAESKASLTDTLKWMQNSLRDEGMSPVLEDSMSFTQLNDLSFGTGTKGKAMAMDWSAHVPWWAPTAGMPI